MGMDTIAASNIGQTIGKEIFFLYLMPLYEEVTQENKFETDAAAVGTAIKWGRNSMAKIPRPNPLTRCTKLAPVPTSTSRIISFSSISTYRADIQELAISSLPPSSLISTSRVL